MALMPSDRSGGRESGISVDGFVAGAYKARPLLGGLLIEVVDRGKGCAGGGAGR